MGIYYFSIYVFLKLTLILDFNTEKNPQKHLEIFYGYHLKSFINPQLEYF